MHTELAGTELNVSAYQAARARLQERSYLWLISGVAGFIGSHLLENLLMLGQRVRGIDNFMTGHRHNLDQVRGTVGEEAWSRFAFVEDDVRSQNACVAACKDVDFVLHHAALGSVVRSIEDPLLSNDVNVGGFVTMMSAARQAKVRRFVYAASSAVYGDHPGLPKTEANIGKALSPYAVSKHVNELYADVFARCYDCEAIGLRYFNVFGPRQDPDGAYAAVIPQWIAAMIADRRLHINGDGESSRDYCFVGNAVQANLLAALADKPGAINQVYNIAAGGRTTLNALYGIMTDYMLPRFPRLARYQPHYADFREGDVRHSQADISKAAALLGFAPTHDVARGLKQTIAWYIAHLQPASARLEAR